VVTLASPGELYRLEVIVGVSLGRRPETQQLAKTIPNLRLNLKESVL
jgi:hypothetical protein